MVRKGVPYCSGGIDDREIVAILESAANPSRADCQDQDLTSKLGKNHKQRVGKRSTHGGKRSDHHGGQCQEQPPQAEDSQGPLAGLQTPKGR